MKVAALGSNPGIMKRKDSTADAILLIPIEFPFYADRHHSFDMKGSIA